MHSFHTPLPHAPRNSGGVQHSTSGERRRTAGFTLLEILLAVTILALLASVLIGGATQALSDKPTTPDEVFWSAVEEARKLALKSERDVTLVFADERDQGKNFIITNGSTVSRFNVPFPGDLEVTFLRQQRGNLMLIGGTVVETNPVKAVTFYPDGGCTAFRVQFFQNGATRMEAIDQWTCARVLSEQDSKNGGTP